MNIVNSGNQYRIYGDALSTFKTLPAQTYTVGFHPNMGFWLEKHNNLETNETKVYGNHEARAPARFFVLSLSLIAILA